MSEGDDRKVVSLRVAHHRRDWGEGTITEITTVLNKALEDGERIMIFVARSDGNGAPCRFETAGFTRHASKVSWLELLAMLQIKMAQWYLRAPE